MTDCFITVDTASAQDLDDGFVVEPKKNGWLVSAYIACPGLIVKKGMIEYEAAEALAETIYYGRILKSPMFPRDMVANHISLLPDESRKTLKVQVMVDKNGHSHLNDLLVVDAKSILKLSFWQVCDNKAFPKSIQHWLIQSLECSRALYCKRRSESSGLNDNRADRSLRRMKASARGQLVVHEIMTVTNKLLTNYCEENKLPILLWHKSIQGNNCYVSPEYKGGKATFTSPIWRFSDFINNNVLLSHLGEDVFIEAHTKERCALLTDNLMKRKREVRQIYVDLIAEKLLSGRKVTAKQLVSLFKHSDNGHYLGSAINYLFTRRKLLLSVQLWVELITSTLSKKLTQEQTQILCRKLRFNKALTLQIFNHLKSLNVVEEKGQSKEQKLEEVMYLFKQATEVKILSP